MKWHLSEDKRTIRNEQNQIVMGLVVKRMTEETLGVLLQAKEAIKSRADAKILFQIILNFFNKNIYELEDFAFEIGKLRKEISLVLQIGMEP